MNNKIRLDQRLPKKEIIRKRGDFQDVLQNGKQWQNHYMKYFFKNAERRKVGFVVPKRFGKAVLRNRMRRLMREVYRKHRHEIGSYDIVIIAKERAKSAGLQELKMGFEQFLSHIGVK